ncbi:uncharacterized protein LOC122088343 [Macadamia integrifolia]|uniref:uncharacterized protein LOC122088343 n=1 Tax=Macadamia integrifolia TaxID=60698 RepID=UPI001C4EDF36|nr:uncharacterized protein LOC122088343 [Macadamia integrifolia]
MAEDDQKTVTSKAAGTNRGHPLAFLSNFGIKFPPWKEESKTITKEPRVDKEVREAKKPDMVRFPDSQRDIPPLKLEVEESEKGTDPRILWQVYALGGFFILKWILARWNERRPKDDSSGEPPSHGDD